MKAIGADNKAILIIFLVEASIIGLIGGIGGTVLGTLASKAVEVYGQVHPLFYFKANVSSGLILFGLTFSFLVGSIAGLFPASQAAKLKPVDALRRYE
jgi:putative ABC transport system permease protein